MAALGRFGRVSILGGFLLAIAPACTAPNPDYNPETDGQSGDQATGDLGQGQDGDLGPRIPWRLLSPTPAEANLQDVHGLNDSDYYLLSANSVIHRVNDTNTTEWSGPSSCLRSVFVLPSVVLAAGGCQGNGRLLRKTPSQSFIETRIANLELYGVWAQKAEEIFVASPAVGVLRIVVGSGSGATVEVERTTADGEAGTGPVALWGSSPTDLYAVGANRILHRDGPSRWTVERQTTGEVYTDVWGADANDVYVVGSALGQGAIWHRRNAGAAFVRETIETARPVSLLAVYGNGRGDVYAAAEGGLVLRRADMGAVRWVVDRPGAQDQAPLRGLWGATPQHLLAVGPSGLARRRAGVWDQPFGQALTGVNLNAVSALLGKGSKVEAYAVGDAGAILHLLDGVWKTEGRGVTTLRLLGVAASPSGIAYAVGERGVILRRDALGTWTQERAPVANQADLLAVTMGQDGIAVGDQGTVLVRQPGVWKKPPTDTVVTLRTVAVLPDGQVVAGGDNGTLVLRKGQGESDPFVTVASDAASGLSVTSVVGLPLSPGSKEFAIWAAVSRGAQVLILQNGKLSRGASPISEATGIWGSRVGDVYLSGRDGSLWHSRTQEPRFQKEPAPTVGPLFGLSGTGETVFAVGQEGLLLAR